MYIMVATRAGELHRYKGNDLVANVSADTNTLIISSGSRSENLETVLLGMYAGDLWAMWSLYDPETETGIDLKEYEDGTAEDEEDDETSREKKLDS